MFLCVVAGALEVGLTALSTGRFAMAGFALFIGQWLVLGLAWSAFEWTVLRASFGPGAEWKIRNDVARAWDTHMRKANPGLTALVPALAILLGTSVAWARFVVVKAHHPTWIALTR